MRLNLLELDMNTKLLGIASLILLIAFNAEAVDLKSKKADFAPKYEDIEDEVTQEFGKDITSVITKTQKDTHDDLSALNEDKMEWKGAWVTATNYEISDVVTHNSKSYACILKHISAGASEPGVGGSWTTNWTLISDYEANTDVSVVVQVVNAQYATYASDTTPTIPDDDTKPTYAEGVEYITLAITPTSATNKLLIEVVMHMTCSSDGIDKVVLLFQDGSGTDECIAVACGNSGDIFDSINLVHYMTSGTTSATTFQVRAGASSSTWRINGDGTRKYGGALISSITITEIIP